MFVIPSSDPSNEETGAKLAPGESCFSYGDRRKLAFKGVEFKQCYWIRLLERTVLK
jgi:hypothetical protein